MSNLNLITIFLVSILLGSCTKSRENDLSKMNLSGKILSIRESDYGAIEKFGEIIKGQKIETDYIVFSDDILYLLNKSGNLTDKTVYKIKEKVGAVVRYKYDKKDNIIELTIEIEPENNLIDDTIYQFQNILLDDFVLSKIDSGFISKILYQYDTKSHQIIKDIFDNNNQFCIREIENYNNSGKLVETNSFNKDGALKFRLTYSYSKFNTQIETNKYDQTGNLATRNVKKIDKGERLIEEKRFGPTGKTMSSKIQKFNKKGILIENYISLPEIESQLKLAPITERYTYIYDKKGNWIQKITWKEDKPSTITERVIVYSKNKLKDSVESTQSINPIQKSLIDINKEKGFKISFKQFLKEEGISLDLNMPNKYETILPKNFYSNYYFNIATKFPDYFLYDRGVANFSIFRAFQPDSGITIVLNVIPIKLDGNQNRDLNKEFQQNPLEFMNKLYNGNYLAFMINQAKTITTMPLSDYTIETLKIRSENYLISKFKYSEFFGESKVDFQNITAQTVLWNNTYSFSYSAPLDFSRIQVIYDVLSKTSYLNPDF